MRRLVLSALAATVCTFFGVAPAQEQPARDGSAQSAAAMTDGEVRKVDRDAGKITLRHGAIANLEMPAMTMVFKVVDPKVLDSVKEGDEVRFAADRMNGALTITRIERRK